MACAQGFAEYAPPVFQRSVRIVHSQLVKYAEWQAKGDETTDEPDKTFLIVALDLLSGLTQGLGPLIEQLITSGSPQLLPLIGASLKVCVSHYTGLKFCVERVLTVWYPASSSARSSISLCPHR
jgi:transportin-1